MFLSDPCHTEVMRGARLGVSLVAVGAVSVALAFGLPAISAAGVGGLPVGGLPVGGCADPDVSAPTDPATFAAVVALLGAVAFAASYLPARRAARIPPLEALRAQ